MKSSKLAALVLFSAVAGSLVAAPSYAQTTEGRNARPESLVEASNSVTVVVPAGTTREQFRNQANRALAEQKSAARGTPSTVDEPTYNRVMDSAFALIEAGSATTGDAPAPENRWQVRCSFRPFDCRVWNDTRR